MRIVFWNIRAGGGRRAAGIFDQLVAWNPDIIGLSEFRGTPASQGLAAQLRESGWQHQLDTVDHEKRATNSLLLASRFSLERLSVVGEPNDPRRWLAARVFASQPFKLGLVHAPNYTTGRKYPFLNGVLDVMKQWVGECAMVGGDTNSGKRGIDEEKVSPVFFMREHRWMEAIEALGWVDSLRYLHGDKRVYSWYSHRNNGFRLDEAFVSPPMRHEIHSVAYVWGVHPQEPERREGLSDHAAVILDVKQLVAQN